MIQFAQCQKQFHNSGERKHICLQPNCVDQKCSDYKLSCNQCLFDIGDIKSHFIEIPQLQNFCIDQSRQYWSILTYIQKLKDKIAYLTTLLNKYLSKLVVPESTYTIWNSLADYLSCNAQQIDFYDQITKFKQLSNYRIDQSTNPRSLKLIDDHLFDKLKDQMKLFDSKLQSSITQFQPIPIDEFIFIPQVRNQVKGFQVKCKQNVNIDYTKQCFSSFEIKPGHMLVLEFQVEAVNGSISIIGLLDLNKQMQTNSNILLYKEVHQFEIRPEIVQEKNINNVDYLDHGKLNIINYVIIRYKDQTTIQIFVNYEYLSTIQIEGSLLFQPFTKIQHPKDNIWFKSEYLNKPTIYYT